MSFGLSKVSTMAHQALYRRYRPSCFAELRGQESVVRALQNAVRQGRVGHAYLFSGPRGTGKTSTARILAKALNCTDSSSDGEPCGRCQSCIDIAGNTSYDLIELDAASNNKVDDIRDLISRVAMGSPGKAKVYVLDEVHMLTSGAENALLKTLEEPPDHVVFVLCTTEPHKVVPTIRSRTQHLEFSLIDGDVLADHARWIIEQAGLEVDGGCHQSRRPSGRGIGSGHLVGPRADRQRRRSNRSAGGGGHHHRGPRKPGLRPGLHSVA